MVPSLKNLIRSMRSLALLVVAWGAFARHPPPATLEPQLQWLLDDAVRLSTHLDPLVPELARQLPADLLTPELVGRLRTDAAFARGHGRAALYRALDLCDAERFEMGRLQLLAGLNEGFHRAQCSEALTEAPVEHHAEIVTAFEAILDDAFTAAEKRGPPTDIVVAIGRIGRSAERLYPCIDALYRDAEYWPGLRTAAVESMLHMHGLAAIENDLSDPAAEAGLARPLLEGLTRFGDATDSTFGGDCEARERLRTFALPLLIGANRDESRLAFKLIGQTCLSNMRARQSPFAERARHDWKAAARLMNDHDPHWKANPPLLDDALERIERIWRRTDRSPPVD